MLRMKYFRFLFAGLLSLSVMLAAVLPAQAASASQNALIRFTFENDTDQFAALRLESDSSFYYLSTLAGETKVYTPARGTYDYTFWSCGTYVSGTIDLNGNHRFYAPPCGTKSKSGDYNPGFTDGGDVLRLVRLNLENDTTGSLLVILEGPSTFVFTIAKDKTNTYTVPKGTYRYTLYACGTVSYGNVYAEQQDKEHTFTCK